MDGGFGWGGGLYIGKAFYQFFNNPHHAVIASSTEFNDNDAQEGGGIYLHGSGIGLDLSVLNESTISGNDAAYRGGGLFSIAYNASKLRIDQLTVSGNISAQGGGGMQLELFESSSIAVEDSIIKDNEAGTDGGGILARALIDPSNPFPTPRAITISRFNMLQAMSC